MVLLLRFVKVTHFMFVHTQREQAENILLTIINADRKTNVLPFFSWTWLTHFIANLSVTREDFSIKKKTLR